MVAIALPTGSLEKPTLQLFHDAGLPVSREAARSCRAGIDFPGIDRVVFYKPREIPFVVADGTFQLGLTGSDWIEETGAKVECVSAFGYSKKTAAGWRIALAVPSEHPGRTAADLPEGTRIASEYPMLTRSWLAHLGIAERTEVLHSHGATEGKIPEVADAVVEVVETGTSLRHNGLRVLATVRHCRPTVIASPAAWADPKARADIERVTTLLRAAESGAQHLMLTIVVPTTGLAEITPLLPARWWQLPDAAAATTVVQGAFDRSTIAEVLTRLVEAGAVQIVETPIGKLVSA
jgi:ATP phosphoribosyltransferase